MPDNLATTMVPPVSASPKTMGDLLNKPQPALSATSDMPVIEAPKTETKVEEIKTETPKSAETENKEAAADTEQKPEGEKADETAKTEGGDKGKTAKPISERFSEISAQRRAAEQRADRLAHSLEEAISAIKTLSTKPVESPVKVEEKADPRPARETFETPDAYDTALIEWSARQATRVATAEAEKRNLEQRKADEEATTKRAQDEANAALQKTWSDKRTKALEKYEDYAEIAEREDLQITIPMAHAILNAENGPDIAYYLGKNPEEAAKIAAMQPIQQAIYIGRIESKLEAPKTEVSKAPAPIKPIGSKSPAVEKSPNEMSMDEYAATRTPQLVAGRRPAMFGRARPN